MGTFITIKTFTHPYEAYPLKALMESEGISCFLKDEFTIMTQPLYSNMLGGVKLQVLEKDLEAANALLAQYEETPKDDAFINEDHKFYKKSPEMAYILIMILFPLILIVIFYVLNWLGLL